MSITLDTVNWGSAPNIGVTLAYDSQRSGQDMRYRIYASLAPVTGGSYFGYPVYISLYLDGDCAVSGGTVKAASPDRWSSAIEYDSGWITVSGKSGGTTALTVRLYSGSGSSRDQRYSYALDVEPGSSTEDFRLAAGDAAIGQTGTLTVTKPGSGYTFRFSYVFGGASGTLGGASLKTVSSTAAKAVYQWTAPAALAKQIPNALRGAGTMTMDIYDGGDYVGSVQAPFTAYVPETMRPTATLQVTVVNDNAAVKGWGLCVQGLSRVRYTVKAAGTGGASVRTCRFSFAGQTMAGTSGTTALIGSAGSLKPSATVTDSRGRSVTVTGSAVKVYAYHQPVISDSTVVRCGADGTAADSGAYLKVRCTASCAAVEGRNTVRVRARYRPMGGSWSGYTTLTSGAERLLGGGLAATASYEVELTAADTVGSVRTVRYTAATSQVTLHLRSGGKGAAFGKYGEREALECAWPAVFYGDAEVTGALTLGGKPLADVLWPVGCVRLTAEAVPPVPSPEGAVWESVDTGMVGLHAWRRTT